MNVTRRMDVRWPVCGLGLAGEPLGQGQEVALGVGGWTGGLVEARVVGIAGPHGLGHLVVDFEDNALSVVFPVGRLTDFTK